MFHAKMQSEQRRKEWCFSFAALLTLRLFVKPISDPILLRCPAIFFCVIFLTTSVSRGATVTNERAKYNFNSDWKVFVGDPTGAADSELRRLELEDCHYTARLERRRRFSQRHQRPEHRHRLVSQTFQACPPTLPAKKSFSSLKAFATAASFISTANLSAATKTA